MEQHYIYVSSEDSKEMFSENISSNFIVQLPETLYLHGKWKCCLKEIVIELPKSKVPKLFNICCDICEDSIVSGRKAEMLKRVYRKGVGNTIELYQNDQYVDVNRTQVDRIKIHIKDNNLHPVTFKSGKTFITLHLKRIY